MNLLLFSKWLLVGAVWAPLLTEAEANIEGMYEVYQIIVTAVQFGLTKFVKFIHTNLRI